MYIQAKWKLDCLVSSSVCTGLILLYSRIPSDFPSRSQKIKTGISFSSTSNGMIYFYLLLQRVEAVVEDIEEGFENILVQSFLIVDFSWFNICASESQSLRERFKFKEKQRPLSASFHNRTVSLYFQCSNAQNLNILYLTFKQKTLQHIPKQSKGRNPDHECLTGHRQAQPAETKTHSRLNVCTLTPFPRVIFWGYERAQIF